VRIAQVAPLAESVPPKLYGGTERVVSWLTEELVELGHEVTLFASGDSVSRAQLVPVIPRALRLSRPHGDPVSAYAILLDKLADRAAHFPLSHRLVAHAGSKQAGNSIPDNASRPTRSFRDSSRSTALPSYRTRIHFERSADAGT